LVQPGPDRVNHCRCETDTSAPVSAPDGLRLILETALDAVAVMKSDGVVADWNDCAVGVFGWSRDEAIGRTLAELIIPERYRDAHRNGLRRYLETGQGEVLGRRIEVSGLRKNGEEFPVELSISPLQPHGSIFHVLLPTGGTM
jgi:PAS domain S-box-containing protein